ncbi:hypothetical protein K435DRAFT_523372 [Dendrothele bispora CBS 962.96]|uniref:Uncharacterized protein n=1 Tax=Dendrothele bispora (strain CBS 962.96) TaxID=1314807 RepID=A0A4S8KVR2_DENBC|nr:hypothetical protein K435DRAFT_523372 [Dendrothele bispora CBS 962.96]
MSRRSSTFRASYKRFSRDNSDHGNRGNSFPNFGSSSSSRDPNSQFEQHPSDSDSRNVENDDSKPSSSNGSGGGNSNNGQSGGGGGNNGSNNSGSGSSSGNGGNNSNDDSSGNSGNGSNGVNGSSGGNNGSGNVGGSGGPSGGSGGPSGGSGGPSGGSGGTSGPSGDPNDKTNPFGSGDPPSFGDPGFCPFCINDNDPRVLYEGPWVLTSNGTGPFLITTHETTTSGSKASLTFKGSGIVVFGTVPKSNDTVLPPTVNYTVDAAPPFTTAQPFASDHIQNQPLFAIGQLNDSDHQITIDVLNASAPYLLNHFFVFPHNFSQTSVDGPSSLKPSAQPTVVGVSTQSPLSLQSAADMVRMSTLKATAGVLGSLVVILFFTSLLLFYRLRRLRKSQQTAMSKYVPYAPSYNSTSKTEDGSWSRSMSPVLSDVPRPETIFTTSESIMRYYPSTLGGRSSYSRPSVGLTNTTSSHSRRSQVTRGTPLLVPLPTSRPPSFVQSDREETKKRSEPDPDPDPGEAEKPYDKSSS